MGNRLRRRGRFLVTPFGPVTGGDETARQRLAAEEDAVQQRRRAFREQEAYSPRGICEYCGGKVGGTPRHQDACSSL